MANYTLRDVPNDLHRAWKSAAALKGHSMKDYCYIALQMRIVKDLVQKEVKNESGFKSNVESGAKRTTG